jgi:hypothetical protein
MAKKVYKKIYPLDKKLWQAELRKAGLSQESLSKEMGYHPNHIACRIYADKGLPVAFGNYVKAVYGIEPEAYAPQVEEEPKKNAEEATLRLTQAQFEKSLLNALNEYQAIDYERLYKVIYSAVYEAVKKAWSE